MSTTDNKNYSAPVNENDHIIFLPFNDEATLISCFEQQGNEISSVIIEGIQGVGGIREASVSFLQLIRKLCDQYGAIYIADSVQCGYGRTGLFFSHDFAGVNADIYSMAKGMGNGFPIGGILIAPHIQPKYFQLGTTFGGNHLACASALAVLEVMEEEQLMQNAITVGNHLMRSLAEIDIIQNLRGRGLMIGFDLPESHAKLRSRLLNEYRVFTGEAKPNTVRLLPSLALKIEDANLFIDRLKKAIATN